MVPKTQTFSSNGASLAPTTCRMATKAAGLSPVRGPASIIFRNGVPLGRFGKPFWAQLDPKGLQNQSFHDTISKNMKNIRKRMPKGGGRNNMKIV